MVTINKLQYEITALIAQAKECTNININLRVDEWMEEKKMVHFGVRRQMM